MPAPMSIVAVRANDNRHRLPVPRALRSSSPVMAAAAIM
jgi:hypothetical protein